MTVIAPVIFSGHNERAVVALCRFFSALARPFFLIAKNTDDVIFMTSWRDYVLIQRKSTALTIELMEQVAQSVQQKGFVPALCPTSEFLNRFALEHRVAMEQLGWHWALPSPSIYTRLSDKSQSPDLLDALIGLRSPRRLAAGQWQAPCVLKPRSNIMNGKVQYPYLCFSDEELAQTLTKLEPSDWFAQSWVAGQSFYLCAYLDRQGGWSAFWQENLLQQPGGKSIVLARTCNNPGIDVSCLMRGLHLLGYHGPFMLEIIRDQDGKLYFIEVNPRFWGPLELARKACPDVLGRFLNDLDHEFRPAHGCATPPVHWYAWFFGAQQGDCRMYPAASELSQNHISELLTTYDVYAAPDTQALSCRH